MTTLIIGKQCQKCERFWNRPIINDDGNIACKAFPGGIPKEIILDLFDHRNKHKGDNGLRFMEYKPK